MTEQLESSCVRSFARHETFHPRYGWLRKAVAAVGSDESVFTAEDATVQLGVGKNMVRSIRYWATAAKLIKPTPDSTAHRVREEATLNGLAVFGPNGADPYLEAQGTLWLVHWWLLRPPCDVPVWWLAFNRFTAVEFTERQLVDFVRDEVRRSSWDDPVEASIEKDVSCLLKTYAAVKRGRAAIDDLLDCPFRNLGMIEETQPNTFRFVLGNKPGLTGELVLFAALDWLALQQSGAKTASLSRLANEPGSPGRAFKVGEAVLAELLGAGIESAGVGSISSGANTRQLAVDGDIDEARGAALKAYYKRVQLPMSLHLEPATPKLVSS